MRKRTQLVLACFAVLLGCGEKTRLSYDIGPIGPLDPIFYPYNPNQLKMADQPTATAIPKSKQQSGEVARYPAIASSKALAPHRKLISEGKPGETFGSAIGRTDALETESASAQPQPRPKNS